MGRNSDFVKELYGAFARGDVPAVLGAMDPHIEWREAESSPYADRNPYIGPQAVAEGVFQRLLAAIENFTLVPEHIIDGGETVIAEGRYRGRVRATGAELDAQFAHVFGIRDGRIVRFQQYTDTRQWAEASAARAVAV